MNADIIVIIVGVISLVVGFFIGAKVYKNYSKKLDKKLLENAKDVLSGKRDNKIKIDGEEYDATKFLMRDNDGNEVRIDLKEGGKVQNGRREEDSPRIEEISEQEVETTKEISRGSGKKKRNSRVGSILSRIRRFG